MSVAVRPAVRSDAAEIARCLAALGYGTPADLVRERLARFERSDCDAVFVAGGGPGARRVEVTSGDHRPAAHAFYQAIDYAVDERRFVEHAP